MSARGKKLITGGNMLTNTRHIGEKFNEDGSLRYFPGATIISFLEESNPMRSLMTEIRNDAEKSSFASNYVFLPPSSFHMTVFDLYSDFERYESKWSTKIDPTIHAAEIDAFLFNVCQKIPAPDSFLMKVDYVDPNSIRLLPASDETERNLQEYRNRISEETGIRFPNHDSYQYHMTFGYHLFEGDQKSLVHARRFIAEKTCMLQEKMPTFTIGRPIFCTYSTMKEFIPYSKNP